MERGQVEDGQPALLPGRLPPRPHLRHAALQLLRGQNHRQAVPGIQETLSKLLSIVPQQTVLHLVFPSPLGGLQTPALYERPLGHQPQDCLQVCGAGVLQELRV